MTTALVNMYDVCGHIIAIIVDAWDDELP